MVLCFGLTLYFGMVLHFGPTFWCLVRGVICCDGELLGLQVQLGPFVEGATAVEITSVAALHQALTVGKSRRSTACHAASAQSSQSHAIVELQLTQRVSVAETRVSKCTCVDLVGDASLPLACPLLCASDVPQ
jgi:hypothetical protein